MGNRCFGKRTHSTMRDCRFDSDLALHAAFAARLSLRQASSRKRSSLASVGAHVPVGSAGAQTGKTNHLFEYRVSVLRHRYDPKGHVRFDSGRDQRPPFFLVLVCSQGVLCPVCGRDLQKWGCGQLQGGRSWGTVYRTALVLI